MKFDLLKEITKPIKEEFNDFEKYFIKSLKSEVDLIDKVITYVSKRKGKRFRPRLCILSSKLCGEVNENTYKASSLIEMIHVATLIHDDIVDDADIRRGWPSVHKIWKNKVSILIGDYMFSMALSNVIKIDDKKALSVLSNTAERLSRGEIMQIDKAINKEMTEDDYYKMIGDKTASLFSASCEMGAIVSTSDVGKINALKTYGECIGIMFQIKDDLLDILGNEKQIGKPSMFDLKKNMMTLPLIHILSNMDKNESNTLKIKLRRLSKSQDKKRIRELIIRLGGVDYANKVIDEYADKAINSLSIFDDNDVKNVLISAINYNKSRAM